MKRKVKRSKARKAKRRASPAQSKFRKLVKASGGDMKAAARKWKKMKRVKTKTKSVRRVRVVGKGATKRLKVKRTGRRSITVTAKNPRRYRRVGAPKKTYRKSFRRAAKTYNPRTGGPSAWVEEYYRSLGRARRRPRKAGSRRRGKNPVAKKRRKGRRKTAAKRRRNPRKRKSRKRSTAAKSRPRTAKGRFKKGRRAKRRRRKAAKRLVVRRLGKRSVSVRAANPKRKRRKSRRKVRTRKVSRSRAVVSLRNPKRRRKARRRARSTRVYRGPARRIRNPVSIRGITATGKELMAKQALKDYAYIGGGFLAGAILPRFVSKLVLKVPGLTSLPPMALELGIGAISAATAGIATSMVTKDRKRAVQVAGGALVGALGSLALSAVERYLPLSGFGETSADAAVRRAVETEVKQELGVGGGMGQFLTEGAVEQDLAMQGMGDFVTAPQVEEAGTVSGVFGAEADFDIDEAIDFD